MSKQQRYSKEFQERAVRRMKLGDNVSQLSRELGVHRTCLYRRNLSLGGPVLAGCSPAEPASVFPAGLTLQPQAPVRPAICSERQTVALYSVSQKGAAQLLTATYLSTVATRLRELPSSDHHSGSGLSKDV